MMRPRLFQSLLLLVAAVLQAAGPGSPLCAAAAAAPAGVSAMADCDMPMPAKEASPPAHPDCASPCIAITCPAPDLTPIDAVDPLPSNAVLTQLDGLHPAPEIEPPRS